MADKAKTAVEVADKVVDKVAGGVERLAQAFENMAPEAWEALVRMEMAKGASWAIAFTIAALVAAIYSVHVYRLEAKAEARGRSDGGFIIASLFIALFALGCLLGIAANVPVIIAPEGYAIEAILKAVK